MSEELSIVVPPIDSSEVVLIDEKQMALTNRPVQGELQSEFTTRVIQQIMEKNPSVPPKLISENFDEILLKIIRQQISKSIILDEEKKENKLTKVTQSVTQTSALFKGSLTNSLGVSNIDFDRRLKTLESERTSLSEESFAVALPKSGDESLSGIGADAVGRKKKSNIEMSDDEMMRMFTEWLNANGYDASNNANYEKFLNYKSTNQTLICDTNRDMDVIQVENVPTIGGLQNLQLFVPRTDPTIANKEEQFKIPKPTTDPAANEQFAKNYVEMLILSQEMDEIEKSVNFHNTMSSILFRCLLSLVLGYLYNNGLDMLNSYIFLGAVEPDVARDIAFQFVQDQVDDGNLQEGDYEAIGKMYDSVFGLLIKKDGLSPLVKNLVLSDDPEAPMEQNFETILEMIVRISKMAAPESTDVSQRYFRVLQGVCVNITLLLQNYNLIVETVGEIAEPYWSSVVHLAANDSTIMDRLQSIIILAVAYNSYGWLFTVLAPLALPSLISVGGWGMGTLARLPFSILKFTSKGALSVGKFFVGYESKTSVPAIDANSENTLIQIGWTKKIVGDVVKYIPHMVSKGDVQRLSHHMATRELAKPSVLSRMFDAHGVADNDLQGAHGFEEWSWYLRQTNPIGNLISRITEEFAELTTDDDEPFGHVKTLEERMFTLFFKTIGDENVDQGFTLYPLVKTWTDSVFSKIYSMTQATKQVAQSAEEAVYEGITTKFDDTLLEAFVIMISSSYVNYIIKSDANSPSNSRTSSVESQPKLQRAISNLSDDLSSSQPVRLLNNTVELYLNSDITDNTIDSEDDIHLDFGAIILGTEGEEEGERQRMPLINLGNRTPVTPGTPLTPGSSSFGSVKSTTSSMSSTSCQTRLVFREPTGENVDPKVYDLIKDKIRFFSESKNLPQYIKDKMAELDAKITELTNQPIVSEIEQKLIELNELRDKLSKIQEANIQILQRLESREQNTLHLSGFLVVDAVGSIINRLSDFSLWVYPPENQAGGYRRRSGPILATIGRKIVNNGIYRAIKPKLIASVYGKSKGRQRKRYTKKHGMKKARKQTTKKIRRKRRSTHKKYKRR